MGDFNMINEENEFKKWKKTKKLDESFLDDDDEEELSAEDVTAAKEADVYAESPMSTVNTSSSFKGMATTIFEAKSVSFSEPIPPDTEECTPSCL
jgi:hypothetical protein